MNFLRSAVALPNPSCQEHWIESRCAWKDKVLTQFLGCIAQRLALHCVALLCLLHPDGQITSLTWSVASLPKVISALVCCSALHWHLGTGKGIRSWGCEYGHSLVERKFPGDAYPSDLLRHRGQEWWLEVLPSLSWPSFPGTLSYLLIAVVREEFLSACEMWRHGGLFLAHTLAL